MTTLNALLNQVINELNQDENTLLQAYSEYSSENGYDSVYYNYEDDINMLFESSHNAVRSAFYGDYNPSHTYFTFNGYGNLVSFNYLSDGNCPIDFDELAQWLIDNDKLSEYDLDVITLDDKYNAVLDHISDIDSVADIQSLLSYLNVDFIYTNEWVNGKDRTVDSYIENYIELIINDFIDKDDDMIDGLIQYFKIDI